MQVKCELRQLVGAARMPLPSPYCSRVNGTMSVAEGTDGQCRNEVLFHSSLKFSPKQSPLCLA